MATQTYLALDIGEKRIGVAVGSVVAFGRGTIGVTTREQALSEICALIEREGVTHIVVGLPKLPNGEESTSMRRVYEWLELLSSAVMLPITLVDETLTSREAERQLREEGVNFQEDKGRIDERAAQLILEQFLSDQGSLV